MNHSETQPRTMLVQTPEDLLAMVPVLLGFVPEDSVTLLTLGAGRRMHARVDLPPTPEQVPEMVHALVQPCVRHHVARVALVFSCDSAALAAACAAGLRAALMSEGIIVVEMLRADGQRWFPLDGDATAPGTSYDLSAHPFVAQAVLRGEVVFASRQELAASLDPDRARTAAVAELVTGDDQTQGINGRRLRALMRQCAHEERPPTDREVASVVVALTQEPLRDDAWEMLSRELAVEQVRFFRAVLVAAPRGFRAAPAGLLAFAAWLAGHGALAWCALDRVPSDAEDQTMADLVRSALERAVPPSAWGSGPPGRDRQS